MSVRESFPVVGAAQPSGRLLLTVEEMASDLGIGRTLAWQLVREGTIPSIRLGRLVRIPRQALEEWVSRQVERKGR